MNIKFENKKIDSKYSFKDTFNSAKTRGITLKQQVLEYEKAIEDPRVAGFLDSATQELYTARKKSFLDGVEDQFAYNGFTALDYNIRRPLAQFYALKHVPHIYGGGAVETDKAFFTNFATQKGRLASGNNNKVNLVKSNAETLEAPILPITLGLFVGAVDLMKAQTIGYDVIGMEGEAVRISFQLELEKFAFVGHRGIDGTTSDNVGMARGLLNLTTGVGGDAVLVDLDASDYTTKYFEDMTTPELTEVLVTEYTKHAESIAFDSQKLANKILFYPSLYAKLTKPAIINSAGGTVYRSHLEYIKAQIEEINKAYGGDGVMFDVLPYLAPTSENTVFDPLLMSPGTNGTGRIVIYRQDPYVLRTRLALDLTPGAIVFDPANNGMRRNYIAFVGTPIVFYPGIVRYIDNGTKPEEITPGE